MSSRIINLTSLLVIREIEDILADYPAKHPYQVAFSTPYLRQKLIAYVLSHTRNRHIVIEDTEELSRDPDFINCSLEEQLRIETLIHKSIPHILQENLDLISS